jgi:hypothetical protein
VENAHAIAEALDLIAGGVETLRHALVGNEDAASLGEHASRRPQRLDGMVHVVQGLEDHHQVITTGELRVAGVVDCRRDPLGQTCGRDITTRSLNRLGVHVDPVDKYLRIGERDRER